MRLGGRSAVFGYAESDSDDSLPAGWEERAGNDGRVYYVDHGGRRTQWAHPRTGRHKTLPGDNDGDGDDDAEGEDGAAQKALPNEWQSSSDPAGRRLYTDAATGASTYTDPRLVLAAECTQAGGSQVATLRQRHDAGTHAPAVLSGLQMDDTVVAMTGATSGAGLQAAVALLRHGARLVVFDRFNRRRDKRGEFMQALEADYARLPPPSATQSSRVALIDCDLASLRSVQCAAGEFNALRWPLHVLILNAAVCAMPYTVTVDGLEATFQINTFAQYYLLRLLKDALVASQPSRVLFTSAESHRFLLEQIEKPAQLNRELFTPAERHYWHWTAYNLSRLCNIWLAAAANRRYAEKGVHVASAALCTLPLPGNVRSRSWLYWLAGAAARPLVKSASQAAATMLYAAVSPDTKGVGGHYFCNCWLAQPSPAAADGALQEAFWTLCAHWYGDCSRRLDSTGNAAYARADSPDE